MAPKKKGSKKSKTPLGKIPKIPTPTQPYNTQANAPLTSQSTSQSNSQTNSQRQSSILSRSNRLDNMFSQSQLKRMSMFEEDEGFIYKRSQDDNNNNQGIANKKLKTVSTPISRMNEALAGLDSPNYDDFIDYKDQKGGKLSSPIRPRYDRYEDSSDEFIEQVSHHKIDLEDNKSSKRKDYHNHSNDNNHNHHNNDRRASYNNRGKRILSIGNGLIGLPHDDVSTKDYYKLLDNSLPEPYRMKQLLNWCMNKRIETNKGQQDHLNGEDLDIAKISQVIEDELINDLRDGKINTSWYNNNLEYSNSIIANKEILLPNPLNQTTKENIKKFEKELKLLKREKLDWQNIFDKKIREITKISLDFANVDNHHLENYFKQLSRFEMNKILIDEEIIHQIETINNDLINKFLNNIELSIDKLYNLTHQLMKINEIIEQYRLKKLVPKVNQLSQDYLNKSNLENYQNLDTIWKLPNKSVTLKDVVNGLVKLDYHHDT